MKKRLKSFGIVFGAMFLTAFMQVLPTVEFANLVGWAKEVVTAWGVPSVVWAFGSALLAQLWFAWRNHVNSKREGFSSVASAQAVGPDLY